MASSKTMPEKPSVDALIATIKEGNLKKFKTGLATINRLMYVSRISAINECDKEGHTLLITAVVQGRCEIARLLLSLPHLDVNATMEQSDCETALIAAITHNQKKIFEHLLSHPRIDPNASLLGTPPIHHAIQRGNHTMLKRLVLHKNILINGVDSIMLRSPACLAIIRKDLIALKIILAGKGSVEFYHKDWCNKYALDYAREREFTEALELVKEYFSDTPGTRMKCRKDVEQTNKI